MLLDEERYDEIWDWVRDVLKFKPSVKKQIVPFQIPFVHTVYDISQMNAEQIDNMDELITEALLRCTEVGGKLYALDWQHDGFLYDPRSDEKERSKRFFPSYYPDGDYYFFMDEKLRFGYLSHPWRKEVWMFGDALVKEFEGIYQELGWKTIA